MLPIIKSKSLKSNYDQTGASKRDVKKDVNEDGVSLRETNPKSFTFYIFSSFSRGNGIQCTFYMKERKWAFEI